MVVGDFVSQDLLPKGPDPLIFARRAGCLKKRCWGPSWERKMRTMSSDLLEGSPDVWRSQEVEVWTLMVWPLKVMPVVGQKGEWSKSSSHAMAPSS